MTISGIRKITSKAIKRKRAPKENEQNKNDDDSSDDTEGEQEDDIDQRADRNMTPSQWQCFSESYHMNKHKKWILTSGTCVEDVLFENCKQLQEESLLHSWIIDLDDNEVERMFSKEDWAEIARGMKRLPQVDEKFAKSIVRFAEVTTTTQLREILEMTSFKKKDERYYRQLHYDAEWADLVMWKLLTEFEDPNNALCKNHLEGWYDANVWSFIVHHSLRSIAGMELIRKESTTVASTARKNRKRTNGQRTKMGHRSDGIVRAYVNDIEYGAIEVSRDFKGITGTKWLRDAHKLVKTLHDMLVRLCEFVHFEEGKTRQLQVVGLLHAGYVSVFKCEALNEVPVKVEKLKDLIKLLASVWQMKKMIMDCVLIVNNPSSQFAEEFLDEVINNGMKTPLSTIALPWSLDTPMKLSIQKAK
ncbi:hypothetical protein BC936DRAFT_136940 [Jimgerdemannia flammicorona]|uniref:Uncharacterized protein n=2 Tax=Jimgerdemannia flammicorona TaxID=994334 RepID=A0A433CYG0_9FUNG|nr:hypothetical protein BC936DRAFT_136940 [Jimgerdemannia flammicorona]